MAPAPVAVTPVATALAAAGLGVLGLVVAAAQAGTGGLAAVALVALLVVAGNLAGISVRHVRGQGVWFDLDDVGVLVALVVLPLPRAVLVVAAVGLLQTAWQSRRSRVLLLLNGTYAVLLPLVAAAGAATLPQGSAWRVVAAAAALVLLDQLVGHPVTALRALRSAGAPVTWRGVWLGRGVVDWLPPLLATGAALGLALHVQQGGSAWLLAAVLLVLGAWSRGRMAEAEELVRAQATLRLVTGLLESRSADEALRRLDDGVREILGVPGVELVPAAATAGSRAVQEPVPRRPRDDVPALVLRVDEPPGTLDAYAPRRAAAEALLAAGAAALRQVQSYEELAHAAHHDALTGLLNRAGFVAAAEPLLAALDPQRDSAVLVFLDLDGFKAVNDTLGHRAGDNALVRVARALRGVSGASDVCARFAGDEFCVLLLEHPDDASASLTRLRAAARHGWEPDGSGALRVTASTGTATWPSDARSLEGLLSVADRAMYADKRSRAAGPAGR